MSKSKSMSTSITSPEFLPFGYINGFRRIEKDNKVTWFAQVSLIVDRNIGNDKDSKPFIFESASLPLRGTALQLVDMYETSEGAEGAWCNYEGKKRLLKFKIKGWRTVIKDDPKYPVDRVGRIISIEDPRDDGE